LLDAFSTIGEKFVVFCNNPITMTCMANTHFSSHLEAMDGVIVFANEKNAVLIHKEASSLAQSNF